MAPWLYNKASFFSMLSNVQKMSSPKPNITSLIKVARVMSY